MATEGRPVYTRDPATGAIAAWVDHSHDRSQTRSQPLCKAEGAKQGKDAGVRTPGLYSGAHEARDAIDGAMSEAEWQKQITDLADQLGYLWYHNPDSRRSNAGYPDLVLCHPERGVCFSIEVKAQKGRLSHAQQVWAKALIAAGARYYCWRPNQWDEVQQVLGGERW